MLEIRPSEAILKRLDSRRGGMRDLVGAAGVLGRFCAVLGREVDDGFEVDDDALGFLGVTVDCALRCSRPCAQHSYHFSAAPYVLWQATIYHRKY